MNLPPRIVRDSYWIDVLLAAGEYPGAKDASDARARIARFEEAGVDVFLDLTHPSDRLQPYEQHLRASRRARCPIVDMSVPTNEEMAAALDTIDAARAARERVYVHCWGGIGRTGTVIGCWLVRHGASVEDAIGLIRERRSATPDFVAFPWSPQTQEQVDFVVAWAVGR